ncbi:N-6 DNA methylase [Fictibacillus phosphorivorans]|uniref:N-6 DNA methylase n=1 Tax=Fictibacillus phosphorivorans TaxID=1221500 RepID=UPI001642B4FE|nr:N-6 DNA methylase [Fictibacillus phosphorivorans]
MFEQTFKNIDDVLWKDAGCGSQLDYIEQTSWILFLKYLDDLERDKSTMAELSGKPYKDIIRSDYKWDVWAAPKDNKGKLDYHRAMTGDDLKEFVNNKLFPYLQRFKLDSPDADTIEYKIGEIFSELNNKIQSGYNLREVINLVDQLRFRSHAEKYELSHLYEDKIKNMGNAGRNGGEYYTPRPLIKTIVNVVAPKIGDKIYDGAAGSAGFLVEAFDYLKTSKNISTKEMDILQKKSFYGKEKKSLAYIIGIMNMILHGIEAPNIVHTNTLAENIADIQEKDRYDIILANPPFGGKERSEVQQNFPIKTGETASLFLQHFIKIMKANGRAGIVIKNTFLSNVDNASINLRKQLLENCDLHTVLDLPSGTFTGVGQKTVVLFFEKGTPTKNIWYYQLNLDRNLGKTNPLNENDLLDFVELQKLKTDSINSWTVNINDIDNEFYDLSVKNPNKENELILRQPEEILEEIEVMDNETIKILSEIKEEQSTFDITNSLWEKKKLEEVCTFFNGKAHEKIIDENGDYIVVNSKFISSNGTHYKKTNEALFPLFKGDITMVMSDVPNGKALAKCFLVDEDNKYSLNQRICAIRTDKFINKFLYYQLNRNKYFLGFDNGENQTNLRKADILNCELVIPPYEEQQFIIDKLDIISHKTRKLEAIHQKKQTNLDELKKSIMNKTFYSEF